MERESMNGNLLNCFLFDCLIKGTWGLSRYEFRISGVINKFTCPLERAKVWGKEKIDGIQTESFTCMYCMHTELFCIL